MLELEQEHVQLHEELLRALDRLYLAQQGHGDLRDREAEDSLTTRRQLQLSMEKGAAMLRALQRISKLQDTNETGFKTTEDLLAARLGDLMQENYELDYKVKDLLKKETTINRDLREERIRYSDLVAKMTEASDRIHEQKRANTAASNPADANSVTETDRQRSDRQANRQAINDQNQQIEELFLALKIHGGYDPLT